MVMILLAVVSIFVFRFRRRAALELNLSLFNISWPFCADNAPTSAFIPGSVSMGFVLPDLACVYRKLTSEHIDDAALRSGNATRCNRSAEPDASHDANPGRITFSERTGGKISALSTTSPLNEYTRALDDLHIGLTRERLGRGIIAACACQIASSHDAASKGRSGSPRKG
jgi:hypothetical protein